VTDAFRLLDNQWGNPEAQQSIRVHDDGSYGWEFDATGTGSGINYPEVLIGTKPWGTDTGVADFPIRRGDVEEFVLDIEAEYDITDGEWDWAQEWWLLEESPDVETETHQYEVMLLLDWGGGHDHGTPVHTDLWTDQFGNTVDLWALYDSGGTQAPFYIFRIQGGHNGGKVDMKPIVDWLTDHEGVREDLLISGSELGNEYWHGAVGTNTVNRFNLTINGTTYTSGNPDADLTAPTPPSNLSSPRMESTTVDLGWDSSEDTRGSGVAEYNVYVDSSLTQQVPSDATATTVTDLTPATAYEFAVTAVDNSGNESDPSNSVSVTTDGNAQSGSVYRLENAHSGLVLDVENGSTSDGGNVHQWSWAGGANQRWRLIENDDGTYRLENEHSRLVLDVENWSTSDGGNVHQWSWTGGANQRWHLVENDDGTYRLENAHSGLVLDVESWSTADGANVHQWSWTGGANQRWLLSSVE
jgi:chitodextrinase